MAIWFTDVDIEEINNNNRNTIHKSLGIKITEVTDDTITVDANYPLADKALTFDIELVAIA